MRKMFQPTPDADAIWLDDEVLLPFEDALRRLDDQAGTPPAPCREAYAAVHVILRDVGGERTTRSVPDAIDWEATFALRQRIASHGFGIAEAMDTAQRYELGWDAARQLIEGTGALRLARGFVAGASTDHQHDIANIDALADAWSWQANHIAAAGGGAVLLPQPALTAWGLTEEGFVDVYSRVLDSVQRPVLLHWLGEMFHPAMRGYFPGDSFERLMERYPDKIRGAKLSLLDAEFERRTRRRARARGQIILTGDDFHFGGLIGGDAGDDFSHALLGIFDAVARPAGLALRFLAHGDRETYDHLIAPCEALGQAVFEAPTQHYKCGLAFLSWLNGWQNNPYLIGRVDDRRNAAHLLRITSLASQAGCIEDAALALDRLHLARRRRLEENRS